MELFVYATLLQWKRDIRNKNIFMVYYLIPILFLLLIGSVFTSIMPDTKKTLIQIMTVLAVSTGAILGVPVTLVSIYSTDIRKSFIVGNIRLWMGAVSNFISALIHLSIVSLIVYVLAQVIFHAEKPDNLLVYIISLFIYIITSIAVGTVLGLYVRNSSKLTIYSQVIYLPSIMLSGIMFDITLLPGILRSISKVFPATWGFLAAKCSELSILNFIPLLIIFVLSAVLITIQLIRLTKE